MSQTSTKRWDVFISYATEDRASLVEPIALLLDQVGIRVWYDGFALSVGDSLSRSIDEGLRDSAFGVVVLSPSFFSKRWPEHELRGLVTAEIGGTSTILPIWHQVTRDDVFQFSPTLADKFALKTAELGIQPMAVELVRRIRPDIHEGLLRTASIRWLVGSARGKNVEPSKLQAAKVKRPTPSMAFNVRLRLVHQAVGSVLSMTYGEMLDAFLRNDLPTLELEIWERISVAFQQYRRTRSLDERAAREAVAVLLNASVGPNAQALQITRLTAADMNELRHAYYQAHSAE